MGGSKSSQTQQTSNTNVQQSFVDNSDNSDNSRVDIYTDNSDNSRTDIMMEGIGAGANIGGSINIVDGGAFELAGTAVKSALDAGVEYSYLSNQLAGKAIDTVGETARYAIDGSIDLGIMTAETLRRAAEENALNSNTVTSQAIEASNKAMERNAALIQTTALGGQDLLVDMVKKVLMGFVVSLGVAGVSYAVFGGKK